MEDKDKEKEQDLMRKEWQRNAERLQDEEINSRLVHADDCPDDLLPGGPVCPRCGGRRGPSGAGAGGFGGSWVHWPQKG